MELKINVPEGMKPEWQSVNGVPTLVLVKDEKEPERAEDVRERVKTFGDAVKELQWMHDNDGDELAGQLLVEWQQTDAVLPDLAALLKLRIITYALNEGWQPQFTTDEYRWWPWFKLLTQEEIDERSEEERGRVVLRAYDSAVAYGGLVYTDACNASSYSSTVYGSRLAFKSEALADYAGEQFREIYADWCFKAEK